MFPEIRARGPGARPIVAVGDGSRQPYLRVPGEAQIVVRAEQQDLATVELDVRTLGARDLPHPAQQPLIAELSQPRGGRARRWAGARAHAAFG